MAKQVGKGREIEKTKIIATFRSFPTGKRKFQKNSKKIQKLNNIIMASFQAKIGGKMFRKRENKNYNSVSFLPDVEEKIPKKQQKNSKIEKHHDGFIPRKKRLENAEKGRKQKFSLRFVPSRRARENSKKIAKKLKKLKNTITASFQAKTGGKMLRKRENKNYHSVSFLPDVAEKITKKQQKYSKIEKYHYGYIPRKNRLENADKGRK